MVALLWGADFFVQVLRKFGLGGTLCILLFSFFGSRSMILAAFSLFIVVDVMIAIIFIITTGITTATAVTTTLRYPSLTHGRQLHRRRRLHCVIINFGSSFSFGRT